VIGFCQSETKSWIHPLADLGYRAELLEEKIPLIGGKEVKPDVVAYSKRLNDSLVVDCKGGASINQEQLGRYQLLTSQELKNYITLYDINQHTIDRCIVDFQRHHDEHAKLVGEFPCLTMGDTHLTKSGKFTEEKLDSAFDKAIAIPNEMVPPTSYYPFSDTESQGMVVKEVIRVWFVILQDKRKRNLNVFADETYSDIDVLKTLHPMYGIMGQAHRDALVERVLEIVRYLQRAYSDFTKHVFDAQNLRIEGADIQVRIANLVEEAQQIIEQEDQRVGLDRYLGDQNQS